MWRIVNDEEQANISTRRAIITIHITTFQGITAMSFNLIEVEMPSLIDLLSTFNDSEDINKDHKQ